MADAAGAVSNTEGMLFSGFDLKRAGVARATSVNCSDVRGLFASYNDLQGQTSLNGSLSPDVSCVDAVVI